MMERKAQILYNPGQERRESMMVGERKDGAIIIQRKKEGNQS
jgi:hypothetical protein